MKRADYRREKHGVSLEARGCVTDIYVTNRHWRRMSDRGVLRQRMDGRMVILSKRNPRRRDLPKFKL